MKNLIVLTFVLFFLLHGNLYAKTKKLSWKGVATLDVELLEEKARAYINEKMPELKGAEIKLVQANVGYYKNSEPTLDISFIHSNSFKPMDQNKTLGDQNQYFVKYYMEFVFVEFSQNDEPIKIKVNEALLGGDETSSRERFLGTYNSF
ncbi:hypothetical protein Sps_00063 [Shewanella psychrophila]|uniref:Uncharacterized protein n=1 Tax=Shewanella psychrophila TaxID=225848 RepID=A0A1S6HIG0_9GAMM|nr:hypothetical protein [Shewanella psychrophila]AQS35288.1 hypothetical protein Sps_00063 [Shewanella psychrophila]